MAAGNENICGRDLLAGMSDVQQATLLRTLIDSALDAIIAHEPDGSIVFFSRGACDLLGYSPEQMQALPPFGWVAPDAMRGGPGRLEAILHDGQLTFDSRSVTADGRQIPTEVAASRVESEFGPLVVAVIRDTTNRIEAESHMAFLAYHDTLTGLSNRTAFEERLRVAIADAKRYGDLLVLAYIDLDRFKPVNDLHGHAAGDMVLVELAKRLMLTVREQDTVARLGGDEFVILLQRVESVDEIDGIASRLLEVVREPISVCGADCDIDASIGFAVFDPDTDDARSLVVKADHAMYAAKRDDTTHWRMWDSSLSNPEPPSS